MHEGDVTQILAAAERGDPDAIGRLLPLVYDELRQLASRKLAREPAGHTLQATALVNEAYLRLVDQNRVEWRNRAHFFGVAAELMRRILVDHARGRLAALDPDQARVVELRYFGGLNIEETAEALGVSPATVKREWAIARAWLQREIMAGANA